MMTNLRKIVIHMSRMAIYALIICQAFAMTYPNDSKAQRSMLVEISIHLDNNGKDEWQLIDLISFIESKSDFVFSYSENKIESLQVKLTQEDWVMMDLLKEISIQGNISIKRVNENISLNKMDGVFNSPSVTELLLDQIEIQGVISDENGEPLPGATVLEKGTTNGTITDVDGKFKLSVSEDAVLNVSFVGYLAQEVQVGSNTDLTITMQEDSQTLGEVIVVGYGTQKKSDLTGAIENINGDDLQKRPVARVDQALQGQMSGVFVQQSGGKPGKNANIRIRGIGSITAGVDPLYVVDGFPVDGSTFSNMNLANIESIEVLKDAAATSIYGSRGSNGVIILTTKQGREGQKVKLDFNAFTGIANVARVPEMLNAKEQMELIADEKDGDWVQAGGDLNVLPLDRPYNFRYDQNLLSDPNLTSYDHMDAILQTGITQNYNLSASGSAGNTRYYFSGEYYDQTGIIKNTSYKRYSARANINTDLNDHISIGLKLSPTYVISNDKGTEGKGGLTNSALSSSPILPPRLGYWGESNEYSTFLLANRSFENLAIIEHLIDEEKRLQLLADIHAEVKIFSGLTFKTRFGTNIVNIRRDRFENQIIRRNQSPTGSYWGDNNINWLNENILTFSKTIGSKHELNAIVGYTAQKQENQSSFISANGFANDYVSTLNAATEYTANTTMSEWSLLSYLSRINYSFNDKYVFQASLRRDGSSRFGANNKWGWFPSGSAAWKIGNEEFMRNLEFISQLKLRVSWGITGNNSIGNYAAIGGMTTSSYLFGVNETITPGLYPSSISNPNLSWEKTNSINLGLDVGLYANKISLAVDFYKNITKDLLLNVPVPTITGFSNENQNYGEVENKGVDISLNTFIVDRRDFSWTTSLNISFIENKVLKLGPNNAPIFGGFENDFNITTVNKSIGSYYMLKQIGVYNTQEEIDSSPHWNGTQPGDIIIEDYNGDGIIDEGDRQILGSNIPKFYGGITNVLNYKGFDLSVFFNGAAGNVIFNTIGRQLDRPQGAQNVKYKHWVNRWKSPENPGDGMTPRMWGANTGAGTQLTSRMLYDGDYIRLKNLTLGYTFSNQFLERLKLSSVRIYLQGENLFTWDYYYVGFSPEADMYDGESTSAGNDYGIYPTSRTFLFGLNLSF